VLTDRFRRALERALVGILGIVLVTVICRGLEASFAVASFLFLIVILLQSLAGDFLSTTLLSIAAVGCLDYFFVDPRHSFAIAHGDDAIALLAFLTAALVVTRLVSRVSAEVATVRLQRRRQARLYGLAQQLLARR
jgi:two-component system sensor histidine kinase KdpD